MNERTLHKLKQAIEYSERKLGFFRAQRNRAIKMYVGSSYGDSSGKDDTPLNMLALQVNILIRQLAARSPKVLVSTPHTQLKGAAWDLELAINETIKKIQFGRTLRRCVLDALFCQGICKIGLHETGSAQLYGSEITGYSVFAKPVDLDNYITDMASGENPSFVGDKYRVLYDELMKSSAYDSQAKKTLGRDRSAYQQDGTERADSIGAGTLNMADEFQDTVELMDIYLPAKQLVITIPSSGHAWPPLKITEWNGPQRGPYHRLGFIDVPNNPISNSPVFLLMKLHELCNRLYVKNAQDAIDSKEVFTYSSSASEDAMRIINAANGEAVKCDDPNGFKQIRTRGVDNMMLAFSIQARSLYSYMAGNLDALGGLSPQADTARQEELLTNSASTQVQDMQALTIEFTRNCCEAMALFLWNDPLVEIPLVRTIPGYEDLGIGQEFIWSAENRKGEFLDYNFSINPYSMRDKTPQEQLQTMMAFVNQVYMPNIQSAMQQGITLNFEAIAHEFGHLADMPELESILIKAGPPQAMKPGVIGDPPPKPAMTERREVRINRPGTSQRGNDAAMMQVLAGSKLQESQRNALVGALG